MLAAERCKDIHPTRWDFKYGVGICLACESWGQHAADALEPLNAERVEAAKAEAVREVETAVLNLCNAATTSANEFGSRTFVLDVDEFRAALDPEAT